ncbi:MAG TPA: BON domain-containing protein [Anaerolineae bacterium]|nr:BON domain-containing protein [Anaerolineae bacterium]
MPSLFPTLGKNPLSPARSLSLLAALLAGCAGEPHPADGRRDTSLMADQAIEFKVRTAVYDDDNMAANAHVSVTSINARVLLTGETPTQAMRNFAVKAARNVEGVKEVYDELAIAPPSSLKSRSHDTWLSTKVRALLLRKLGLDGRRIKVTTERKVVYLLGVITRAEGKQATEIARNVEGVEKVATLFEFVD